MTRHPAIILCLLALLTSIGQAEILKGSFKDHDGKPIPDLMVFAGCRDNYFFTDENGEVLIYAEPQYDGCAIEVYHADFQSRRFLPMMDRNQDTTFFEFKLVRLSEPEPVMPNRTSSRFNSFEVCDGNAILSSISAEENRFEIGISNSTSADRAAICLLAMSDDEVVLQGEGKGYDLEQARRVVFEAASLNGTIEASFFALADACPPSPGTCPETNVSLDSNFQLISIDLTRWNLNNIESIWGCKIGDLEDGHKAVIAVKNLRIVKAAPPDDQSAGIQ